MDSNTRQTTVQSIEESLKTRSTRSPVLSFVRPPPEPQRVPLEMGAPVRQKEET